MTLEHDMDGLPCRPWPFFFAPLPIRIASLLLIGPSLTSAVDVRKHEHRQTYEIVKNEELVMSAVKDFSINLNHI